MKQETIVSIVVEMLNGIEVDGETMVNIIDRVNMKQQMLGILVINSRKENLIEAIGVRNDIVQKEEEVIFDGDVSIDVEELTEKIIDDVIDNITDDDISSYDLEMEGHEVVLKSIELDQKKIRRQVKTAIQDYVEELKERNTVH